MKYGYLMVFLWCFDASVVYANSVDSLQKFLSQLQWFEAYFTQTLSGKNVYDSEVSSGRFYLHRPGKFRWQYQQPYAQEIVADGQTLWLYDVDLEQVSMKSQKASLNGTPADLLSTQVPVSERFELRDLPSEGDMFWLALTPKNSESQFSDVRIALKDDIIQQMILEDHFGQTTSLVFSRIRYNQPLNPELFVFVPPDGVDQLNFSDELNEND
jgi:outer membrane lipoprotein carrier protein